MGARHGVEGAAGEGVTIARDAQHGLIARKTAPPGGIGRLVREVAVLRLLDGLPVPVPLAVDDDASAGTVELCYVGPGTLAEPTAVPPDRVVAALAEVGRTLEAAHRLGVSHRRLEASHVLLDPQRPAVVTGWAEAGLRSDVSAPVAAAVAATGAGAVTPEPDFDPAADVAALGALADEVTGACPALGGRVRTQLAAVAAAARHPDPAVRPSMAELARVLALAAPAPTAPGEPSAPGRPRRRMGGPARRVGLAGATAVATAALVVLAFGPNPTPSAPEVAASAPRIVADPSQGSGDPAATDGRNAASNATSTPAHEPVTAHRTPPTATPPPPDPDTRNAPHAPDAGGTGAATGVDGGGPVCPTSAAELASTGLPTACAATVSVAGRQLRIGSATYELGRDGDQAGLSDPLCSGRLLPTLWERATRRVYVFDRWAKDDSDVTGRLAGRAGDAIGLADPHGAGCGPISLATAGGTTVPLAAGSP